MQCEGIDMKHVIRMIVSYALCMMGGLLGQSPEIITSFVSKIIVRRDATMQVQETISYTNAGIQGLHGIFRDFPTRYKDRWGNTIVIGFQVEQVLRDDSPVPYHLESRENGRRLYIGDAASIVPPGEYVYTILYTTNRQLGFFSDHDELYWNVTGNGWRFPIMHASVQVTIPEGIFADKIEAEGYTGYQGEHGRDYAIQVTRDGVSIGETTKPLAPKEGFTIVVSWPKGFVQEPSFLTKVWYVLRDNLGILWLLLGLIILSIVHFLKYQAFRRIQKAWAGTIIPRFYPPDDLSPSMLYYINKMRFDTKAFAAEIVHMAVRGLLIIHYGERDTFWKTHVIKGYSLEKKKHLTEYDTEKNILHTRLQNTLFKKDSKLVITQANHEQLHAAIVVLKQSLSTHDENCFYANTDIRVGGILFAILFCGIAIFIIPQTLDSALSYLLFALYALISILFNIALRGYTKEGMKLNEEIEGFKLFLATTETERLKIVGTPPTKTPELYETYLPYAIALGVEDAWSAQFAPIFARYEQEGHPYIPVWYVGAHPFSAHGISNFSHNLGSAFSNSIASSATPPGSSSGRGGRGSSGGGGGGGGGGSW